MNVRFGLRKLLGTKWLMTSTLIKGNRHFLNYPFQKMLNVNNILMY